MRQKLNAYLYVLIEYPFKTDGQLQILSLATFASNNHSTVPFLHITAPKGHVFATVSLIVEGANWRGVSRNTGSLNELK
jgi:hypothetical protein